MILKFLLDIIFDFLSNFLNMIIPVGIPALSDDVMEKMYSYLDLFDYAAGFITFFIPPDAFRFGFKAVVLLFSVEKLYPVLMWLLRKIPFLNIS